MKKLRFFQWAALSLLLAILISCNQHSGSSIKNRYAVLKFNRHKLMDKKGTGMVAATYLVPEGWKVQDKIEWNINNVAQPANAELLITDEETNSSMQGFPNLVFVVNTDASWNEEYPAGSSYLGAEVLNKKPGVLDLIKNYILPEYRNIDGLSIKESKNLSLVASNHKRAAEFKNTDSKSGVVKIEYTENGKVFEETIFGTITFFPVSRYQEFVYLSMCYGCKAEKGNLKGLMGIFETILNSVKMNPRWAVTYKQVVRYAMQNAMRSRGNNGEYDSGNYGDNNGNYSGGNDDDYGDNSGGNDNDGNYSGENGGNNGDNSGGAYGGNYNGGNYSSGNAGSLSNYLQQANESINDGIIQNYENEQRANDRVAEGYSDYTLDYQNYTDPNTGDVYKLSSGYDNAWTDNNGSVVMSSEAGYDPNVGGTSSWSSLDVGGSTVPEPAATTTETSTE